MTDVVDSAGVSVGADVSAGSASADVGTAERFFVWVASSSGEGLTSLSSAAAASRSSEDKLSRSVREVPDSDSSDASASERRVEVGTDPGSVGASAFPEASLFRVDESADCDESCPADRLAAPLLLSEESVSAAATPWPAPSAMHAPALMAPNHSTHRRVVTARIKPWADRRWG